MFFKKLRQNIRENRVQRQLSEYIHEDNLEQWDAYDQQGDAPSEYQSEQVAKSIINSWKATNDGDLPNADELYTDNC